MRARRRRRIRMRADAMATMAEPLRVSGLLAGHFSIWVNGNYRMTFRFDGTDAILVDYQDYH